MKAKHLVILALLAAALGIGGLIVARGRKADFERSAEGLGGKLVAEFDVNKVQGLRISQGTNRISVVKSGDNWVVKERGDYPANFGDVAEIVRKIAELKVVQPIKVGPSRYGMLELTPEAGVQLDLLDAQGQVLRGLTLGKKHVSGAGDESSSPFGGGGGFPNGRYVKVSTPPGAIALVSETFGTAATTPDTWVAKDFIKVEQPVSVVVRNPDGTNSFTLTRTNELADWKLEPLQAGEELDKNKLFSFNNLLSSAAFKDVVVAPDAAKLGLDKPTEAEIRTAGGFTYKIKIGKGDNDTYAFTVSTDGAFERTRTAGKDEKPEDKTKLDKEFAEKLAKLDEKLKTEQAFAKWTYTVDKWSIDALLKKRSELLAEKKADAAKAAPALPGGADNPTKIDLTEPK
jgi:Domain of unknown function (DUF4340)